MTTAGPRSAAHRNGPSACGVPRPARPGAAAPVCLPVTPHLIDLHAHTTLYSYDSGLTAERLIRRSLELGLSAVCTTEHNGIWTRAQATEARERFGITVLRGMEISTDAGHVLVFGVEGYRLEMMKLEQLRAIVEREGGAMVLAHPTRNEGFRRPWSEARHLFEALEGMNGDDHNYSSEYLLDLARGLGLPATGGSDAHSLPAVGRCATVFAEAIRDEQHLVRVLRSGAFFPVDLSQLTPHLIGST
jgi:predicted metal-dependent phosphoesterase TrpH